MKRVNLKTHFLIILVCFTAFIMLSGCKDSVLAPPADNLDFSVMGSSDTTDTGLLIIDEVKLLVKDIKLNVASSSQDTANFKVGPFLIYLNLTSSVTFITSSIIPVGTYDKVRFMVHKLGPNENVSDPDFVDLNNRYSVVVKGRFSGVPFIYKSDKSAHQKLTFPNNLQVTASGKSNITLHIKPYIWFISGGVYLDPNDPNNRATIDNNIKDNINNNFKIFVDNDKNGQPD